MAWADDLANLKAARGAFAATLANEALRELALTDAGHPMLVTYSAGGRSFQWTGSWEAAVRRFEQLNLLITRLEYVETSIRAF